MSNTIFTSGTVSFVGAGGGITALSTTNNQVVLSVNTPVAQSVQTQSRFNLTLDGNTLGPQQVISSGSLTLVAGNNIVFSQNGNAVTVSANNQTVQTQNAVDLTMGGEHDWDVGACVVGDVDARGWEQHHVVAGRERRDDLGGCWVCRRRRRRTCST